MFVRAVPAFITTILHPLSKAMPFSRRAVSPVIATVILIAVAVALGIAVAVWAGGMTGSLQRNDKLIVLSIGVASNNTLLLSLSNQSPYSVSVSQIFFNDLLVPAANITGSYTDIPSGTTAVLDLAVTAHSGISYPLTLWLTSGTAYPVIVSWP